MKSVDVIGANSKKMAIFQNHITINFHGILTHPTCDKIDCWNSDDRNCQGILIKASKYPEAFDHKRKVPECDNTISLVITCNK